MGPAGSWLPGSASSPSRGGEAGRGVTAPCSLPPVPCSLPAGQWAQSGARTLRLRKHPPGRCAWNTSPVLCPTGGSLGEDGQDSVPSPRKQLPLCWGTGSGNPPPVLRAPGLGGVTGPLRPTPAPGSSAASPGAGGSPGCRISPHPCPQPRWGAPPRPSLLPSPSPGPAPAGRAQPRKGAKSRRRGTSPPWPGRVRGADTPGGQRWGGAQGHTPLPAAFCHLRARERRNSCWAERGEPIAG